MSEAKNPAAVALGRSGGIARAKSLTPEQRKRSAMKAARAAAEAHKKRAAERKRKAKQ